MSEVTPETQIAALREEIDRLFVEVEFLRRDRERLLMTRPQWYALHQAAYGDAMSHDHYSQARLRDYLRMTANAYEWTPPAVARVGR